MRDIVDVFYTDDRHPMQMLDMHLPDEDGFTTFVYFHGGGIVNGDRTHCKCLTSYLPPRGVGLVSVEYRMYPDAKFPDFVEDAAAAVAWVMRNIGSYGGNGRVIVGGSSAGGYLSQLLCFDKRYLGAHGIDPCDVSAFVLDAGQPTTHFNVLRERGIDTRREIIDEAAPLYYVGLEEKYPPMLIIYSDNDIKCRPEQTLLLVASLEHFGYDMSRVEVMVAHGTHCSYCGELDENGESVHGKMIYPFIKKYS